MAGKVKNLQFVEGLETETPNDQGINTVRLKNYANDAAYELAWGAPAGGEKYWNTTDKKERTYNEGTASWQDSGGSGSGGGDINYLTNPDAESNTSGWVNTGSAVISRTQVAGQVLRGTASFRFASTGAGTIYTDFTIPEADAGKQLKIAKDLKEVSGYVAGAFTLKVIQDPTGSPVDILPRVASIPTGQGKFITDFGALAAGTYRLIYTCLASTNGFNADTVSVGPSSISTGFAGWKTYNESDANVSASGWTLNHAQYVPYKDISSGKWRLVFNFDIQKDSGTTSSQSFIIAGVTFSAGNLQGLACSEASTGAIVNAYANPGSSNVVCTRGAVSEFNRASCSGDVLLDSKPTWADDVSVVNLLSDETVTSNMKLKYASTAGGSLTASVYNLVKLATKQYDDFNNYDPTTGIFTAPSDGKYSVNFGVGVDLAVISTAFVIATIKKNDSGITGVNLVSRGWGYGQRFVDTSTTVDLLKGETLSFHVFYSGAARTLETSLEDNHVSIDRVSDISSNAAFGFGAVDTVNRGLAVPPTSMADSLAAQLGKKVYTDSDADITSTGWSKIGTQQLIPYQMQDGTWRLKFNIELSKDAGQSSGAVSFVMANTAFKGGINQAFAASEASTLKGVFGYAISSTGILVVEPATSDFNNARMSGDLALNSKPSWVD